MSINVPSTCILVLGMHRSGTSLVSAILNTLGVNMGTRFRPPDAHNSTGYYEDLDWRDLNKSILAYCGATWYRPPHFVALNNAKREFSEQVESLAIRKSTSPLWGFKDPRTCLTIPCIYHHLPIATLCIYVRRDEDAVVDSLMRRAELRGYYEPPVHWHSLYRQYNNAVITFLEESHPRFITITYEQLTKECECSRQVRTISEFIGVKSKCLIEKSCALVKFR